jgi:hypothetical protein
MGFFIARSAIAFFIHIHDPLSAYLDDFPDSDKIPYADVVREYVFDVVGMPDSGYDDPRKVIGNRAAGYEYDGNRVLNASYIDMSIPHAAGGNISLFRDRIFRKSGMKIPAGKIR